MRTKKAALIFNWTLTISVILLLGLILIQFNAKYSKFEPLGKKQLLIFQAYQKAESALFYIDESAKYSLQQAVYDLAKSGGIPDYVAVDEIFSSTTAAASTQCGKFFG